MSDPCYALRSSLVIPFNRVFMCPPRIHENLFGFGSEVVFVRRTLSHAPGPSIRVPCVWP